MKDRDLERVHPALPELAADMRGGRCSRREFLRTATLLGLGSGVAYGLAGLVEPGRAFAAPRKGGALRVAMRVQEMSDPATFDWTEKSNIARHIVEYLTITGPDNVTRPYLAKRWEASDDLRTWTFHLRRGVLWSNGDPFTADDVVFNFARWLDPATGSSNYGLFRAMLEETGESDDEGRPVRRMTPGAVEKIDDHTVRLNLNEPALAIPENLYHYPTAIVHRDFDRNGGNLREWPVGTGPFALAEHRIGEIAVLRRRAEPYWGGDVHLDAIQYIDMGEDPAAAVAALASGQVDVIDKLDLTTIEAVEAIPFAAVHPAQTAQTGVIRMKVTEPPFTDRRVRRAIQLAADNRENFERAHRGLGALGENHHVARIHPEYFPLPPFERDVEAAKALLAEAGREGLELSCAVGNTQGTWEQDSVAVLKQNLAEAGITLNIDVMPAARYWEIWKEAPFALTAWGHRPLGTMALALAYRSDVPWNETGYANREFDAALAKAESSLDVEERRKAMEACERILQDDAVMVQPFFRAVLSAATDRVRNYETHPALYHQFNDLWLES